MSQLWTDLRQGTRSLLNRPLLSLSIVASLVLGIGLNTSIFTLLNALFLRPVAGLYEPDRVISLFTRIPSSPAYFPISYRNFIDLRSRVRSCSSLAAYQMFRGGLAIAGPAHPINGEIVSAGYFATVGKPMAAGRAFIGGEDDIDHPMLVTVISETLWQLRFGRNPAAVGGKLLLNGHAFTIVGVAPRHFAGMTPVIRVDLWVPASAYQVVFPFPDLFPLRSTQALRVFGRLRPASTVAAAGGEIRQLGEQLEREHPDDNRGQAMVTFRLAEGALPPSIRPKVRQATAMLMAAAGLLLLMSCTNIANLLLAQSLARAREMAIRLALGASRRRLIQELILESLLLSLIGGAASVLFAVWCRDMLWHFRPPFLEQTAISLTLDPTLLAVTLLLSLLTGLLFGLLPAVQATRPDLTAQLKGAATNAAAAAPPSSITRKVLLALQLCLCTTTLGGAALLLSSLHNAQHLDPGFSVSDVVALSFDFKLDGYDERRGRAFEQRLLAATRALPFVTAAAIAENRLLGGFRLWENVYPNGRSSSLRDGGVYSGSTLVGPDYFATTGIPLLSGREFHFSDDPRSAPVAIINQTMAAKLFPHENPIGRTILIEGEKTPVAIIGIAMNSSYTTLGQNLLPFLYLPLVQRYSPSVTLHVRLARVTAATIDRLRREVQALDPGLPLLEVRSIPSVVNSSLWAQTLSAILLSIFSLIALALAATGTYSLVAHFVASRQREIGVRLALGASRARVLRLVLRQNAAPAAVGTVCGLVLAGLAKGMLAGFLYSSPVPGHEPLLLPVAALVLIALVLLASLGPALGATRTDPVVSMRNE
jgi:predicted permease